VGSVLPRAVGVEARDAAEGVGHAAARVLTSGLVAVPVAPADPGGSWRLRCLRGLLAQAQQPPRPVRVRGSHGEREETGRQHPRGRVLHALGGVQDLDPERTGQYRPDRRRPLPRPRQKSDVTRGFS